MITKTKICFAFVDDDGLIDHIPLSEVDFVMEMNDAADDDDGKDAAMRYCMQIATNATGYNSGRTYYIATKSKEHMVTLMNKVKKYAEVERTRAEASSLFRKMQLNVRRRYESSIVQVTMALMIGAVRYLNTLAASVSVI